MPEGINKVFLLGQILTEPQLHTYDDCRNEYHFTLVTTENCGKKDSHTEHLEYHHIRLSVELSLNYQAKLAKGQFLHVEGRIHMKPVHHEWDFKLFKTEVIVCSIVAIA